MNGSYAMRAAPVWLVLVGCAHVAAAQELAEKLRPLLERHQGQVAVAVRHLDTGESFGYRQDEPMPTASLIKFPVMVEAYQQAADGKIDLQERVVLNESDKVPGSGVLSQHLSPGASFSLYDAVRLMIAYSDNTATNLVLDQIGIGALAERFAGWSMPQTMIHAKVFRHDTSLFPDRSRQFGLGSTTARETVLLYEQLHRRQLVSWTASDAMIDHLLACQDATKLRRGLPANARLAHKSGAVARARCDAGLVESPGGAFAICVLTSENEDTRFDADNAAHLLCGRVARIVYDHFNPPDYRPGDRVTVELQEGSVGTLVEILQRTLNKRLTPSPQLAVDGDYGPNTRAAVERFQRQAELPDRGAMDAQTWKALGTLITEDDPDPPPNVVNAEILPTSEPDSLTGPPFVTCKAWAIADGQSGELLWSFNADESLDMASTTKVMTALLVARLAESDPAVLEESLVFSPRADNTIGSTAGILAGESLPVREVLYGLLLPSGNDASVALAEHFGKRFEILSGEGDLSDRDPYRRFVAEMNRTAAALEMRATHYQNPHGLTEKEHHTSAHDLVKLALAFRKHDLLRGIAQTRQRGFRVTGPGGYARNIVWKNTNRLLPIRGYEGIKTGTTRAAGACLVSSARRGDDQLIVAVLGAQSSDARYVDARNLYRWAWLQLGHEDE